MTQPLAQTTTERPSWTTADLELLPDDGSRYEIIDNERRDSFQDASRRDLKLKLYSTRGVQEYWVIDWRLRQIEVYRRSQTALGLVSTLFPGDELTTPLLPGFNCPVSNLFPQQ
ncbi:Uma2 family endonuclease [Pseudanabaena sp. PCC 6802]|uniref:Uma2 family endonuclease n=1 Tax=Pseudanabaena sp. PCC 6802 TaxID=118173 RepID=UPI00034C31DF|nr:Uma2 family endonuclease [Pseudanabaena sp. PCC 6802]